MGRVPNQKRIITHRIICDSNAPYTVRRRDVEAYAARTLSDAGFKMWLYMSANKDGYDYNLSAAAVEKEYGIKVKQYRNGVQNLIDNNFLVAIGDSNDFDFIEYPVYPSRIDEKDKMVYEEKNQVDETSVYPSRIDGEKENKDKNSVCTPRIDAVVPSRIDVSTPDVQTSSIRHVQRNNINNIIDNINNNIELSSHNSSTKVENCFKESNVITSRIDGENGDDVLSKDEIRTIVTSDGDTFNLPIENILSGLNLVLMNKQNEDVIKEIREKCDLTEEQKKEIDETLDFWEWDL